MCALLHMLAILNTVVYLGKSVLDVQTHQTIAPAIVKSTNQQWLYHRYQNKVLMTILQNLWSRRIKLA